MADPRQSLQASLSFSGSSTTTDTVSRSSKRRLTTSTAENAYFTPANTFRPRAYILVETDRPSSKPPARNTTRQNSANYNPGPSMDPTPGDSDAIFIHPPFTDFPEAHRFKEGLTYNIMAQHRNWFLDTGDFISPANDKPNAVNYPPQLEPPRGWCPSKKRELKDGWPEGAEPRLRCTFCRRTYAGVNAKSMWRRHVYEKHKIPMSNRRDNGDRKGRGSNKENRDVKEASTSSCAGMGGHDDPEDDTQESVYDTFPGEWQNAPYSSSSLDNPQLQEQPDEDSKIVQEPSATEPFFTLDRNSQFLAGLNFSSTPPVTPGLSPMKSVNDVPSNIILESPYNPSATPSFRHSPARLPIDQPWRFLSPSHPLHSTREVSLAMLVHGEESPIVHGFDSSPVVVAPKSEFQGKGIFGSPFVPGAGSKETASDLDAMFSFADSSPRRFFCETPVAFTDRAEFKKHRIPESPLGRGLSGRKNRSLAWVSDVSLTPLNGRVGTGAGLMEPIQLQGEDPFAAEGLYDSWIDLTGEADGSIENVVEDPIESSQETSPPESSNEGDSPVLRRSQSSQMSVNSSGGRSHFSGPGLMDAVLSKSKSRRRKSNAADSTANHGEEAQASGSGVSMGSPFKPGKKTRRDFLSGLLEGDAGTCEMQDALQPKKRRKTVTGHD